MEPDYTDGLQDSETTRSIRTECLPTRRKTLSPAGLKDGISSGRPADIVFDKGGRMFISDDKAGVIYKVIKK